MSASEIALFDRRADVTVGTINFQKLDVAFSITKTLKPEPNLCELTIYNLTRDHQSQLEQLQQTKASPKSVTRHTSSLTSQATTGIPCRIEAGYAAGTSLVWLGDLRQVQTVRDGPDWATTLTSGDGEKAWVNARLHVSYGPGTSVDTALRAIARSLGVGIGNLSKVAGQLKVAGSAFFPTGYTFSGAASRQLTDFARSAGLDVSIQDGALQILQRGVADDSQALLVSEATGMLESPSVDGTGLLSVKIEMVPGVKCGSLITVDAARIKGTYRIVKAVWSGDTHETDWCINIEATRY